MYVFRRSLLRVVWAVLRKLNGFNDAEIPTVVEEGKKEEEAEEEAEAAASAADGGGGGGIASV